VKYLVYATTREGQGRTKVIAEVDDPTEIEIIVGMFSDDVVITIEENRSEKN
jgi:hypothetical protein